MLLQRLPPQLVGDAQRLDRTEATDTLRPVRVLGVARPLPVACHERTNAVGDHLAIVPAPANRLNLWKAHLGAGRDVAPDVGVPE